MMITIMMTIIIVVLIIVTEVAGDFSFEEIYFPLALKK